MRLFSLYLAHDETRGLIHQTPDLSFDRAYLDAMLGLRILMPLGAPLPVGLSAFLLGGLQERLFQIMDGRQRWRGSLSFDDLALFCRRELRSLAGRLQFASLAMMQAGGPAAMTSHSGQPGSGAPVSGPPVSGPPVSFPGHDELAELQRLLDGRLLRPGEISRALGLGGEAGGRHLEWALQALCLAGGIGLLPALLPLRGGLVRCQRCGWEGTPRPVSCRGCGRPDCCECPECAVMGGLSLCEPLYAAVNARDAWAGQAAGGETAARPGLLAGIFDFFREGRRPAPEGGRAVPCRPLHLRIDGGALRLDGCPGGEAGRAAEVPVSGGTLHGRIQQPRPSRPQTRISGRFRLGVEFTAPQQTAAGSLREFGAGSSPGSRCLVWAACGAGKTEVSYPLIGQALGRGERVLFATPRRDVVLELAPRLERAFGRERVAALYGGSGIRAREAPLVVATTHQTLRWHHHFDLVILDEGDAFPYPGSRMLHYGVEEARRRGGRLVYLTATPAPWMLGGSRGDKVDIIKIPARPHGFPLPEPRFLRLQPFRVRGRTVTIHPDLLNLIRTTVVQCQAPIFLFVPAVEQTAQVGQALRAAAGRSPLEGFQPSWFEWSHAGDQHRDRKRERFFSGEFPVFVTTTIMERGVTMPRVHVIVLWADQAPVFNAPTLVQIAGRCGRSPSYPTGEVWFLGEGVSREMEEALGQIRAMNAEAARLGYLRPDYLEALQELSKNEAGDWPSGRYS